MNYETIIDDFKLPIKFVKHKELQQDVIQDTEFTKINHNLFNVTEGTDDKDVKFNSSFINEDMKYYSTNKKYLKEFQHLLSKNKQLDKIYKNIYVDDKNSFLQKQLDEFIQKYIEFKNQDNFERNYLFIEWEHLKFINKNSQMMHLLSIYNFISPSLSITLPIFILLVPFLILKIKNIPISLHEYIKLLKLLIGNQPVVKIFTEFKHLEWDKRIYLIISVAFYFFQIYQNFLSCIKFYRNLENIQTINNLYHNFIDNSINNLLEFNNSIRKYKHLNDFYFKNEQIINKLESYKKEFATGLSIKLNLRLFTNIGYQMSHFYNIYYSTEFQKTINYTICCNQYLLNICTLKDKVCKKEINICSFVNSTKKTKMSNIYYPFIDKKIYNSINIDKNIILTGPNASGKTTLIKSVLINNILSQKYGTGFYSNARIYLYNSFFSYLNIPDTSERDSLFQSEARRCKEIVDYVKKNKNETCFVIFDELYSGTNYYEAISGGYGLIKFLNKIPNIRFLLTTHYIQMCDLLCKEDQIRNMKMCVKFDNSKIKYLYKIQEGISDIKGGMNVLIDLDYDKEVLDNANKILNELK
jgi:hypothetical protein